MGRKCSYSIDQLKGAVAASESWRGVAEKLGLFYCQNLLLSMKQKAAQNEIPTSHFLGKKVWSGKISANRKDATSLKGNSHSRKLALIRDGYKKHQCEVCERTEWRGLSIPITLHHINGDKHDNRLENLQILCGNCHMQTENFAAKNKRRYRMGF